VANILSMPKGFESFFLTNKDEVSNVFVTRDKMEDSVDNRDGNGGGGAGGGSGGGSGGIDNVPDGGDDEIVVIAVGSGAEGKK